MEATKGEERREGKGGERFNIAQHIPLHTCHSDPYATPTPLPWLVAGWTDRQMLYVQRKEGREGEGV